MTLDKTFRVFQINLNTGETKEIKSVAETYEQELMTCNRLNKSALVYGAIYYVEERKAKIL